MSTARATRGEITYDDRHGHVCTCTEATEYDDDGYPTHASYLPTVAVHADIAPTETGSRAGAWSGC